MTKPHEDDDAEDSTLWLAAADALRAHGEHEAAEAAIQEANASDRRKFHDPNRPREMERRLGLADRRSVVRSA